MWQGRDMGLNSIARKSLCYRMGGMNSDFLFARPSFWGGAARVLDLAGVMLEFNQSPTPEQADAIAMRADWQAVGDDLRSVLLEVRSEPDTSAA